MIGAILCFLGLHELEHAGEINDLVEVHKCRRPVCRSFFAIRILG